MSKDNQKKSNLSHQDTETANKKEGREDVYLYRDSGLQERHGTVPLWLKAVSIGLLVWSIYYTIRYWSTS
jgi:hypothetical protein